jgi:hypothetical protein
VRVNRSFQPLRKENNSAEKYAPNLLSFCLACSTVDRIG